MKKLIIILVVVLSIIGISFLGIYTWYKRQIDTPAGSSNALVNVEIEQGESTKEIARKLESAGVVKNADIFYIYIRLNSLGQKIQAGKFQIPQNLTVKEVADLIQKAAGNDIWITIKEGLRADEIADDLDEYFLKQENKKFSKQEFLDIFNNPDNYQIGVDILSYKPEGKSLEGFIFPDTYNVKKDITSLELTKLFVKTLEDKLKAKNIEIDTAQNLSAYEVLVMASIIERESRNTDERYMVSDILQKRLNGELDGVKLLQADATLLYEEKDWNAVITKELKEKDSPYNTYKVTGLPPTPICNPGIEAISAAVSPKANDYFFYLHDDEGKIHYAKTLSEHNNNVRCFINKNEDYCL